MGLRNLIIKGEVNLMDVLTEIEKKALFVLCSICLFILFINVVLRYLFHYSLGWTEEIATYLLVFIVYIGASVGAWNNSQIRVGILADSIPPMRKYFDFFSVTIAFIFSVCLTVLGFQFVMIQWITGLKSVTIPIPMYFIYAILPLGGLLMSLKYGQKIVKVLLRRSLKSNYDE